MKNRDLLRFAEKELLLDPYTLREREENPEAEMPVPDRLLPRPRSIALWNRLRLSQQIGLLLWLNRVNFLTEGGKERLLYLQRKASFEAIEAGLRFAQRLSSEEKLKFDFKHQLIEANRRPQSKRFRKQNPRRIGVGYRDKGTLPESSSSAISSAQESSWIFLQDIPVEVRDFIVRSLPSAVEGDWFDLSLLPELLPDQEGRISTFLTQL